MLAKHNLKEFHVIGTSNNYDDYDGESYFYPHVNVITLANTRTFKAVGQSSPQIDFIHNRHNNNDVCIDYYNVVSKNFEISSLLAHFS